MTGTIAMQPWDETPMRRDLIQLIQRLPRQRLDRIIGDDLDPVPGVYAHWFSTRTVESALSPLIAEGKVPAYIGVAANLRERAGRYRNSIRGTEIRERDIHIAVLPCASDASARFCESVLIEEVGSPLQGFGYGSKTPGGNRSEQSPFDALFPGRQWASPPSLVAQARARLQVLSRLIRLDPTGPRWPALPTDEEAGVHRDEVAPLATVTRLGDRR